MRLQQLPERTTAEADHAERMGRLEDGRPVADSIQTSQSCQQDAECCTRRSCGPICGAVVHARRTSDGTPLERQRQGEKKIFRASAFFNTHPYFKVAAAFGWGGNAYTDKIGSIQVLSELPDQVRGFDYYWRPFKEAAIFDKNRKEYFPVHVDSVKGNFFFQINSKPRFAGNISPCLLTLPNGKESLGKVDIRNEKASAVVNGKEEQFVGPTVQQFLVLCRKAKPGQKFDE